MAKTLLFCCLLIIPAVNSCNAYYETGTASVSIEPDNETISLTLAGYANPNDGRFTIIWDDMGRHDILSLFCTQDSVLILNHKYELSISGKQNLRAGRSLEMNIPVKKIVLFKNEFYGINLNGELVKGNRKKERILWTKINPVIKIVTLTASDDCLYVVNRDHQLLKGSPHKSGIEWTPSGHATGIISLTNDRNRLYGLTDNHILLQKSLAKDEEWAKIGYKNNITYVIDAVYISFMDGSLYATDVKKHLYKSKHRTVGDLKANAMSIRTKIGNVVVIVGVDVCGFDKSFTDDIKEEICRKRGVPKEAILINTSHTHFAPVTQSWITWQPPNQKPDSLYLLNVVRTGIIKAIEESLDNSRPSRLYFQRGTCDIGKNRTKIEGYDLYDNTVDVITAVSVKDKKKSLLFLAGCHPVFTDPAVNNFTINANFPGFARSLLENEQDIENAIFLQAFAGDINPRETFRKSGKQLADSVLQIISRKPKEEITGNISFYMDTIAVSINPPTLQEIESFKEDNLRKQDDILAARNVRWADMMLSYYRNNRMPDQMPVYYQTLNIGNWKLVALSREVTTEFGIAIRNIWPYKNVSAIAYSNDVPSYLSTDPHIRAKNYEGYQSFFWYAQPTPFPLKTFDMIINRIKTANH
jgi:hypothetical protein